MSHWAPVGAWTTQERVGGFVRATMPAMSATDGLRGRSSSIYGQRLKALPGIDDMPPAAASRFRRSTRMMSGLTHRRQPPIDADRRVLTVSSGSAVASTCRPPTGHFFHSPTRRMRRGLRWRSPQTIVIRVRPSNEAAHEKRTKTRCASQYGSDMVRLNTKFRIGTK